MNRTQLQAILDDPASTPAEKGAASKALAVNTPHELHPDTVRMLETLRVKTIGDLSEGIFERYVATHGVRSTDPIVKEFRFWIPPDDSFLANIGMSVGDWWLTIHRIATAANRADAADHARRKMAEK